MRQAYPILEYDPSRSAMIEPGRRRAPQAISPRCVICFFPEVVAQLAERHGAREIRREQWEDGPHVFYELELNGQKLVAFLPGVGAPVAAGMLEIAIAMGCRSFVACGGAGVLQPGLVVGHLVVPTIAVRDEGTSYHYLPPSREVSASPQAVAAIETLLQERHLPYLAGKTWTTDAPFRETPAKVELRRAEGCLTVEMEAAAFFAVAEFRGVTFGQILYGGDDLSGTEWDDRAWSTRTEIRESLFWLAAEACLRL